MTRIYLSPSIQEHNLFVTGQTEEEVMNKVCDVVQSELSKTGEFEIYRNSPKMTLTQVIADSNKKVGKGGLHFAIHSNASADHKARGCVVFAYAYNTQSDFVAHCVYNQLILITPTADRGVKYNKQLAEIGKTTATATLVEVAFHDNPEDAKWILSNIDKIGKTLAKGICNYVIVPTYTVEVNKLVKGDADKASALLKKAGFNPVTTAEK